MTDFKRIPPEQAQTMRSNGAVIVDIRDPQSYANGHISGSLHLDNHSLPDFIAAAEGAAEGAYVYHFAPDIYAIAEAANSGKEVPMATKVKPIKVSLKPKITAILVALLTIKRPPKLNPANPKIIIPVDCQLFIFLI